MPDGKQNNKKENKRKMKARILKNKRILAAVILFLAAILAANTVFSAGNKAGAVFPGHSDFSFKLVLYI